MSSWTTYTVTERARPAAIAEKIGVDADTLMSVNRIPAGMRLKAGSTIVVPRSDDDDEDISADVAESAVLAVEPDVPDTRKMLIRVRRAADRWRRSPIATTCRSGRLKAGTVRIAIRFMPGQVIVLHVPVGKAMPSEPGPVRIATVVQAAVSRRSARVWQTPATNRATIRKRVVAGPTS